MKTKSIEKRQTEETFRVLGEAHLSKYLEFSQQSQGLILKMESTFDFHLWFDLKKTQHKKHKMTSHMFRWSKKSSHVLCGS